MPNSLSTISITTTAEGYALHLEDDQGTNFDVTATFEQLDLLSEEIEANLNRDEEEELTVDQAE